MMNLIVAIPDESASRSIRSLLLRGGHSVIGIAGTGSAAIALAGESGADLVICGFKYPDMIFTQMRENLPPGTEVILLAAPKVLEESVGSDVFALPMPLR